MPYFPDVEAALDEVVTRLRALDIEAAVNTAEVNVPGAWVKWLGFGSIALSGEEEVGIEIRLIVGAMPLREAYRALVELAEEVVEEFGYPDGAIRQLATTLGNDVVELPSLALPYNVA